LRDGEEREFNVTHWIYSAAELSGLLSDAGFASVELFGDFGGSSYDPAARRLIAVARKRAAGGGEVLGG
jgi:hypothetical protein